MMEQRVKDKLSDSPVPLIRLVCLIPFVCHILGTESRNSPILPIVEYNRVHQLRTGGGVTIGL